MKLDGPSGTSYIFYNGFSLTRKSQIWIGNSTFQSEGAYIPLVQPVVRRLNTTVFVLSAYDTVMF